MLKLYKYCNSNLIILGNRRKDGYIDGCVIGSDSKPKSKYYGIGTFSHEWGNYDFINKGFEEIESEIILKSDENLFIGMGGKILIKRNYKEGYGNLINFTIIDKNGVTEVIPNSIQKSKDGHLNLEIGKGMTLIILPVKSVKFKKHKK